MNSPRLYYHRDRKRTILTQTAFLDGSSFIDLAANAAFGDRRRMVRNARSWRGFCALLVALSHFPATGFVSQSAFIGSSFPFVDFFFAHRCMPAVRRAAKM
ncbi:hypothetical protein D3Y55_15085 [Mesorhizobium sp. DCY119]|nr:hypothetical protein D3Y55_15085 [Mesorhizobium sp. DCY119]